MLPYHMEQSGMNLYTDDFLLDLVDNSEDIAGYILHTAGSRKETVICLIRAPETVQRRLLIPYRPQQRFHIHVKNPLLHA